MESSDNYNFSIFKPRNLHGRKNRNVILTMLLIWAVAVFGFQVLLKIIEKPTPEKALVSFEEVWPAVKGGTCSPEEGKTALHSLVLARGKNTMKAADQDLLSKAITALAVALLPDSLQSGISEEILQIEGLRSKLGSLKGDEYVAVSADIAKKRGDISKSMAGYTGIPEGSLESAILVAVLRSDSPAEITDSSLEGVASVMNLYMTHNQSKLTDTKFLGFPFHYFYTATLLLILFVVLCIVYNILIEWRLGKEGITE